MKYVSTRGGMSPIEFSDVLLMGLAPDGGLCVPEKVPQISKQQLEEWRTLSYAELATEILSLYLTDIPKEDLKKLCEKSYHSKAFSSVQIVPIKPYSNEVALVGLSEGPTLAFKDMAMQLLGNLFEYVLEKKDQTLNILGATSGDTGSAAEYALKGKKRVNVFMLSPYGRMSEFQRAQMYTLKDDNIFNISVKGVFDDCQDIVKSISSDLDFKTKHHLGAVNSINFARIAAQIVYYFWAWLQVSKNSEQKVSFSVPTGNFGNILSGHYARQMGLPIEKLVLATNENNVLEEFFKTGIYRPRSSAETYATSSPSMDISKASNFERFIYDVFNQDPHKVTALWSQLQNKGEFSLTEQIEEIKEKFAIVAGASSHEDRLTSIKKAYNDHQLIIDPHTADALKVASSFMQQGIPMLVLETALPVKFTDTILEAIQIKPTVPEKLQSLMGLQQYTEVMEADEKQIKAFLTKHLIS